MKPRRCLFRSNHHLPSLAVFSSFPWVEGLLNMSISTSFEVFMKYIDVKEDGSVDVDKVFTHECLNEWVRTRKIPPKQPVESYRRTLTAHVKGADQRRPFSPQVEKAMLAKLRAKKVWEGFEGIGRYGFRGQGFHEKKCKKFQEDIDFSSSDSNNMAKRNSGKREFEKIEPSCSNDVELAKLTAEIDEIDEVSSENSGGSFALTSRKRAHIVDEAIAEINRFDSKLNRMYQRVVSQNTERDFNSTLDLLAANPSDQTNTDSEFFKDLALMHESGIDQTEIKLIFELARKCKEENERMISTFWLAKIILSVQYAHTDAPESELLELCFKRIKRLNGICYSLETPTLFENFEAGKQEFFEFCKLNKNFFVPAGFDTSMGRVAIALNLQNFSAQQRDMRRFVLSHAYVLQFQNATTAEMRSGGIHIINARNLTSEQFIKLISVFQAVAGTFFDPAFCQNCFQVICLIDSFARRKIRDLIDLWPKEMTEGMVYAETLESGCRQCGLNLDFSQVHESIGGYSYKSIEDFIQKQTHDICKTEGKILEAVNALGKLPLPN